MNDDADLLAAISGHVDRWVWRPGRDPAAVGAALGIEVSPGPMRYAGHPRQAATLAIPDHPWPAWAVWDATGELLLLEVLEPPDAPSAPAAIASFGDPDARVERGRGPHPSYEQLAYLARGFTLFTWSDAPPAALWLYRPTAFEPYVDELGALISPTRPRR